MVHLNFVPKEIESEKTEITFGTADKQVTIDLTFVPSGIGYAVRAIVDGQGKNTHYPPEVLANMICLFTTDVTPEWLVENCEYGVLDQISAVIIHRALLRRAEKN